MTKGERKKVALAIYKIAKVEERINDVSVWEALDPNGIEYVGHLNDAMYELTSVLLEDLNHGIKLRKETES